jgi:hypothetical protein
VNIKDKDPNNNEIEKIESRHILDPISAADFSLIHFNCMISKEGNRKYRTTSSPLFELNKKIIDQINNIMIDLFPDYYKAASFAKLMYERSKEESLNDRNSNSDIQIHK